MIVPETNHASPPYRAVDRYDRVMGSLVGLPDVTHTAASTDNVYTPIVGDCVTVTVQTFRQRDLTGDTPSRDTIFIVYTSSEGSVRLALPPATAEKIARQRDALSKKNRRTAAKARAKRDKEAGVVPGFMRNGAAHGKRKKKAK
jgi:hypothetical protein